MTTKSKTKIVNCKINSLDELEKKGYVILSDDDIVVPNRIAEVLEEKLLNPSDLVKMTGISRQSINAVMKGKMKPGVDFALKVAYVLDKKVEDIFFLKSSAWVTTAKNSEESTLFIDVIDLKIIDGKTKKEIMSKNDTEYFDIKTNTPLSTKEYEVLLSKYISIYLSSVTPELVEEFMDNNDQKKTASDREIEAYAKKKLTAKFNERYIKRYRKLGKKVNPLVNPSK